MQNVDLILQAPHEALIRSLLLEGTGSEAAAYMLFGIAEVARDPWTNNPRSRCVSHAFKPIEDGALVSASQVHVTWATDGYMNLLGEAVRRKLIPAIVHTHPGGVAQFSPQDDWNEAELARTAEIKGVKGLVSIVVAGNGQIAARLWRGPGNVTDSLRILHSGPMLSLTRPASTVKPDAFLDRQVRLFGDAGSSAIQAFRCGIAGGGGTGSALLPLLMRLGVRQAVLFDKDHIDLTNLNRVHGSRCSDVDSGITKNEMHRRNVDETGLGMHLVTIDAFAGDPETWGALRACDIVFCCTDDHAGRLFLNRFARFYGIPVIDVGLAMQRRPDGEYDLFARTSTLVAGHPCLVCGEFINSVRAREENLRRRDQTAYERLKAEAYVLGEGDPSPAVVTFTTEAAAMAVNEWLAAATGFRRGGMIPTRIRRFHAGDDRIPLVQSRQGCQTCDAPETLGIGDVEPFLDMVN